MRPTPAPLWTPPDDANDSAAQTRFAAAHGLPLDYRALHAWSIRDIDAFWSAVAEHFDVPGDRSVVREGDTMPGVRWFPRTQVNYAEMIFRGTHDHATAIHHASEGQALARWTWQDLRRETARVRSGLLALGVQPGDRVAALLPNLPETVAAFLATASIGAIWSSAAPETGARAVIDRFAQIRPRVLLAVDGYRFNAKTFSRDEVVAEIHQAVGGQLVRFGHLDGSGWPTNFGDPRAELEFSRVAFDHPLWVLYSSGTTGLPKPIVHGHGGMLLEHLKYTHLHLDARPDDRVLWFTTTGWMMWNFLVSVLLTDASIVLYDGSPAGDTLWDLAEQTGTTIFGTSAAFIAAAAKDGIRPRHGRDLQIRAVGSTGSPLAPEGFRWVSDQLGRDTWLFSMSGGTDVCTAFLGGIPTEPVFEGELQGPALGADVQAWDPDGNPVIGEVGELVLAQPMPCMPVGFWADEEGERYHDAYFSHYPGTWRHGDWITITDRGTAVIHGRSDATINRGGVRMGTAEIYSAVLALDEILDALVVDVPDGHTHWMPLFVVLRDDTTLDDELRRRLATQIRQDCSPRHIPDDIYAVPEIPRTLSGKLLEVPIKRLLAGEHAELVLQRDSLRNPAAIDRFQAIADARRAP